MYMYLHDTPVYTRDRLIAPSHVYVRVNKYAFVHTFRYDVCILCTYMIAYLHRVNTRAVYTAQVDGGKRLQTGSLSSLSPILSSLFPISGDGGKRQKTGIWLTEHPVRHRHADDTRSSFCSAGLEYTHKVTHWLHTRLYHTLHQQQQYPSASDTDTQSILASTFISCSSSRTMITKAIRPTYFPCNTTRHSHSKMRHTRHPWIVLLLSCYWRSWGSGFPESHHWPVFVKSQNTQRLVEIWFCFYWIAPLLSSSMWRWLYNTCALESCQCQQRTCAKVFMKNDVHNRIRYFDRCAHWTFGVWMRAK